MVDAEGSLAVLEQLTALGIRLSVDDFGTGFSSLAYLKQLPVSAIKIDRSFVMEMDSDASDRAIVRSTIDLARHLGMEVVAEGVESEDALAELRALGCHLAQGFAISPPLGAEALAAWAAAARAMSPALRRTICSWHASYAWTAPATRRSRSGRPPTTPPSRGRRRGLPRAARGRLLRRGERGRGPGAPGDGAAGRRRPRDPAAPDRRG